jgi:hypothetical protein
MEKSIMKYQWRHPSAKSWRSEKRKYQPISAAMLVKNPSAAWRRRK